MKKKKILAILLTLVLLVGILPTSVFATGDAFSVTFAVEGLDTQIFSVTKAVNCDFSGQTAEEITAGTTITFTPPAQYEDMPNIFRIMGMNDTFADTEEYTYKGIKIEVDGTEYAEYIPADLSELDVAEIIEIGEIELQYGNPGNGHLVFRAASCENFNTVKFTAVYEKKQTGPKTFDVTFAVEGGIEGKTFTVQSTNENAVYTDQPDVVVNSGETLTFAPRPNYTSSPNVFRIKGVNTAFVDTDEYSFKGFRITVDGNEYAELLPSQVEEGFVYQVADEIEIQVAKTGNLTFRAASCENFNTVKFTAVYEKKQTGPKTFNVTFAVEGKDSQTFNVTRAVNGDFTGQITEEISAGTTVTFTPPAQYDNMPNVFRIMGMNDTFADTEEYTYKGIRIEVDSTEYAKYIPADLSELDVAEIYEIGEIEIQFGNPGNGHIMLRAASCENYSNVKLTAVYEPKQSGPKTFNVTFAVEGKDSQTFNVTRAVNGDFTGQITEEITAGTTVTFTPPAQYDNMPNVFRIMGMNDTFADTEEYTYKGIKIEVDGTECAEYIPADLSELDVAEIIEIGEIELQYGNPGNGHLVFRAASCENFSTVKFTAVYEKKQSGPFMNLEISSSAKEASATFEYTVSAVTASGSSDQLLAQKSGFTDKETAVISLNGYENDRVLIYVNVLEFNDTNYSFTGWKINGVNAGVAEMGSIESDGTMLSIRVKVDRILQLTDQKLELVAVFEESQSSETGPSGEYLGDTLQYKTGLNYTFEGQRTAFIEIPYQFVRHCSNVVLKAYYGENTTGNPFYQEQIGDINQQTFYFTVESQSMPKVDNITLELTADGADPVVRTFNVTVLDSGSAEIDWMSPPSGAGGYPTEVRTAISGPNVYDSVAFIDSAGEFKVFLAVSGGVMMYSNGSLTSMEGVHHGYNDNEYASGYALAIGGESEDTLAVFVKSSGESDTSAKYYVAYCNNGVWEKVSGSDLSGVFYPDALVLTKQNIWVSDRHT